MKLGLVGDGKMGKAIGQILDSSTHDFWTMGRTDSLEEMIGINKPDVLIEFTEADFVIDHLRIACEHSIPIVIGTTGWYDRWDEAIELLNKKKNGLFYATNFSVGAHLFWEFNSFMSKRLSHFPDYKPSIEETHHTEKKDAPSGTAITTAERIIENHTLSGWQLSDSDKLNNDLIPVKAHRVKDVNGLHTVKWKSEIDEISITHEAFSRQGFARGAIRAAEFLKGKTGIFTMEDLMGR